MKSASALSLALALGLSLSACGGSSKQEAVPDGAADAMNTGGQTTGSGGPSNGSTDKPDGAIAGTGGSGGTTVPGSSGGTSGPGGSSGTSVPGGSTGTSAPGGSGGTTAPGGSGGTSAPGGSGGTSAPGGSGGTSAQGGSGGSGTTGTGGNAGTGGTGVPASSGSRASDPRCTCAGTALDCLCAASNSPCEPDLSTYTSGKTSFKTLTEYAGCGLTVVEAGGSFGRVLSIYDRATGVLVGRRYYSDIVEPCYGTRVPQAGVMPSNGCQKTKCTEGSSSTTSCPYVADKWEN